MQAVEIISVIGIAFMGYFILRILESLTIGCWCKFNKKAETKLEEMKQPEEKAVEIIAEEKE